MAAQDTLAALAEQLAKAVQPLEAAFSSPDALRDFLEDLGWDLSSVPASLNAIQAPVQQVGGLASGQSELADGALQQLFQGIRAAFQAINGLKNAPGLANDMKNELPGQLVEYLLVNYLLSHQPKIGHVLRTLGIIRLETVEAQGTRPAFLRRRIALSELGQFFQNPLEYYRNMYRWGQSDFKGLELLGNIEETLEAWGFPGSMELLNNNALNNLTQGSLSPEDDLTGALVIYLFRDQFGPTEEAIGLGFFLLPETGSDKPGFALMPFARGSVDLEIPISDLLDLSITGQVDFAGGVGIIVRPNKNIQFFAGLDSSSPTQLSGDILGKLTLSREGEPFILVGSPNASRLELGGAGVGVGTRFHNQGKLEVFFEFDIRQGKIIIKAGEDADGFIAQLLPGEGIQLGFDLVLGFSTEQGLYFGGSSGLEIALPAHLQLGILEIQQALIALKPKDGAFPLDLATTIKGNLGVLQATVENIGMTAKFSFPPNGDGNIGPLDLTIGFKPPNGVGLVVDAGVIKGGGYLFFDFDKGEYAGALELVFSGFIALKAIGIINTKMPDGSPGFSLLIIITAEFFPGFQLGFGFTLAGVGGLIGLNRTMMLEAMAADVRTGAINSVLFPKDVVANAPKIISDLKSFFPIQEGKFLIGPMAKIGWGTPTLISVSLGIIIEIPGNIAILGRIRLNLPTEDQALILIQVTFIGAIEFDKKRIWFFASLYESRILFITLDGDMGLLMDFGDQPNFVLSVGGFHPRFKAPALPFPSPARIALSIVDTSVARVRVEAYFAVTSNTVQFGARAEAFFGFSAINVSGYIGFDALFQFSPFYFVIEFSAGFEVKVFGLGMFGIRLRGLLEGPTPWHIQGEATITLLFFDISVDVDVTFGESNKETLPKINVMPLLVQQLEDLKNWKATLPGSGQLSASIRKLEEDLLVLHPVGTLQISQRAIPLGITFDKVGEQAAQDVKQLDLEISAGNLKVKQDLRERFATAQFKKLSDSDKLDLPPFENQKSGVEISVNGPDLATGFMARREVRYEQIIVDSAFRRHVFHFFKFFAGLFVHFSKKSAAGMSALSLQQEKMKKPFEETIKVQQDGYSVAFAKDNKAIAEQAHFGSYLEAQQFLSREIASDRRKADQLHIIPQFEVNTAA